MGSLYKRNDRGGRSGKWYAQFTNEAGEVQRKCTGTRNRQAANQILAQWELEAAKRKAGLSDPTADRLAKQSSRPILQHVEEWLQSLEAKKRSDQYVSENRNRWLKILNSSGWEKLTDIQPEDLERFIAELQKSGRYENSTNRGARTAGQYIQTAKGFTKWCIESGRLTTDPLRTIKKPNAQTDRKLERRILLPDEWPWLKLAAGAKPCYGVSELERPLLYEFAIQTGLRANEIRETRVHNCNLAEKQPFVTLKAKHTKNSNLAKQYLGKLLADRLRERLYHASKQSGDSIFKLCSESNMARMAKADMEAARAIWLEDSKTDQQRQQREKSDFLQVQNAAGEVFDFHAFRHTCGAWLAMDGVHPKTIQAVMRHSTITLTLDTYGHLMPGAEESAVDAIEKKLLPVSLPVSKNTPKTRRKRA